MAPVRETDYVDAVEQAVDFIQSRLGTRLSVGEVADAACFSRHYFNRLFAAVTGEPIHAFELRLRLERAAFRLVKETAASVTEIAAEAGYSPSNFAVAFKERFGLAPSAYRAAPPPPPEPAYALALARIAALRGAGPEREARLALMAGRMDRAELGPFRLRRRRYRGPFSGLAAAWESFCLEIEAAYPDLDPKLFIGIGYDDPLITESSRLRYDLCVDLPRGLPGAVLSLPRRGYLRYRFEDRLPELVYAFNDLMGLWVPQSGARLAESPVLEIYRSGADGTGRIAVDLCAPLE